MELYLVRRENKYYGEYEYLRVSDTWSAWFNTSEYGTRFSFDDAKALADKHNGEICLVNTCLE